MLDFFLLLGPTDLVDVMEYVYNLNHSTFKKLGLQLGLHEATLNRLSDETGSEGYGMKVMSAWLNRLDSVDRKGKPTWATLARALKHKMVGCSVLGEQIKTYLRKGTLYN